MYENIMYDQNVIRGNTNSVNFWQNLSAKSEGINISQILKNKAQLTHNATFTLLNKTKNS